jgi:CrcB protein
MTGVLLVIASLAGGGGAVLRMIVDEAVRSRADGPFPWGIVAVNVSGSLVLGLATGAAYGSTFGAEVLTVIGAGLLGGYTTFSTASHDTVRLVRAGRIGAAFLHAGGQLVVCITAAGVGVELGRSAARLITG